MSADSSTRSTTSAITPVPERAAAAILGSMIAMIIVLMAILVQTTWVDPATTSEIATVESTGYPQR